MKHSKWMQEARWLTSCRELLIIQSHYQTDVKDQPVELKKPKEIPSDSLQNPPDPHASHS